MDRPIRKNKQNYTGPLACLLILFALLAGITPAFLNALQKVRQIRSLSGYQEEISSLDAEQTALRWESARIYNRTIFRAQQKQDFQYSGDGMWDRTYLRALYSGENGILCRIRIPAAGIDLPVVYGTEAGRMSSNAGHMYGTSLPTGENDTNAVIAGHTGLTSARLFTDLDKLRIEDTFYIHILDEIQTYTVKDIKIVFPDDEDPYLQIIPDRTMVTLYTCTPCGINDHRLIIQGKFTGSVKEGSRSESSLLSRTYHIQLLKTAAIGSLPVCYILFCLFYFRNRKE
ncbi:MAG: class C sortase [Eubacterium sp.]|nr:class C sortase [Eubacterium sp.]